MLVQCFLNKGHGGGPGKTGGKGWYKVKGKGIVTCSHCGKRGHDPSRCWTLHPEQLPWKGADSLGDDYDKLEDTSLDTCSVIAGKWVAPSSHRARHRVDRFAPTVEAPCRLDFKSCAQSRRAMTRILARETILASAVWTSSCPTRLSMVLVAGAAESVMPGTCCSMRHWLRDRRRNLA